MGKHHKSLMDGQMIATTTPQCLSVCQASKLRLVFLSCPDVLLRLRCMCRWHGGSRHRSRRSGWAAHIVTSWHPSSSQHKTSLSVLCLYLSFLLGQNNSYSVWPIFSTNVQMHLCMDDIFCQAIDSNEEIWTGMSLKSQPSDRISSRNAYLRSVSVWMSISGFV